MTRRKVSLAWIANNSSRRASLKKRRLGLTKKVSELATLCGIEACLIIYSPQENEPMVWPSLDEVKRLVEKFYLVPEMERSKKATNMETYMTDKFSKEQEHLMKLNRKNKEVEVEKFMLQMHQGKMMDAFNVNELDALIWFGETRRTDIRKHIGYHKQVPYSAAAVVPSEGDVALQLQPPPQVPATADYDIGGASTAGIGDNNQRATGDFFLWDNWFHNVMNADEFRGGASSSSRRSDMGLTHYNPYVATSNVSLHLGPPRSSYGGSSSIAPELGLPRSSFRGSSSAATEHGPPRPPFDGTSSSVAASEGLPRSSFGGSSRPPFGTFSSLMADTDLHEGGYFGPFGGHDMGPGHYPLGPVGSGSPANEFGGNPFGGESSSSAAASSEIGPSDSNN